jgi:hypothetical protein
MQEKARSHGFCKTYEKCRRGFRPFRGCLFVWDIYNFADLSVLILSLCICELFLSGAKSAFVLN